MILAAHLLSAAQGKRGGVDFYCSCSRHWGFCCCQKMAAETSTFADGSRRSSHRNSNGTEHCLNIVLADRTLSSEGLEGTGEPAPAVRVDGEESPTTMAENVAATVPAPPSTTPMSTVAAPIPMSKCEIKFRNLMAFRGLPNTKENLCRVALED